MLNNVALSCMYELKWIRNSHWSRRSNSFKAYDENLNYFCSWWYEVKRGLVTSSHHDRIAAKPNLYKAQWPECCHVMLPWFPVKATEPIPRLGSKNFWPCKNEEFKRQWLHIAFHGDKNMLSLLANRVRVVEPEMQLRALPRAVH